MILKHYKCNKEYMLMCLEGGVSVPNQIHEVGLEPGASLGSRSKSITKVLVS